MCKGLSHRPENQGLISGRICHEDGEELLLHLVLQKQVSMD